MSSAPLAFPHLLRSDIFHGSPFSRARLSRPALTRAAVGAGLAAALFVGAAAPAAAQPALPDATGVTDAISRAAEAIPGAENLIPGQRTQLGEVCLGGVYAATLYKQVVGSQNVVQCE